MKSFSRLSSSFVVLALALLANSSPVVQRQEATGTGTESARATKTSGTISSSAPTTSGTPEPLNSEVEHSVPTSTYTFGPPTSRPLNAVDTDYPGLAQATAFYSAVSVASALGNITVPFAAPTAFTYVNVASLLESPITMREFVCPTGMVGVAGRCCPGVVVGTDCLRTDTASLTSYALFTGYIHYESDLPGHSGASSLSFNTTPTLVWLATLMFSIFAALGTFL